MKPVEAIETLELFPPLSRELVGLLRGLPRRAWELPTVCAGWSVKDVAAHLLGGNLGRIWRREGDAQAEEAPGMEYGELLELINRSNQEWVQAARRISPEFLVELLELSDQRLYEHFSALDLNARARINVAWAGTEAHANWFDIAREYTEKWLHQQHIRQAVGVELLEGRAWLYPVLDTFLRGLPHTFRSLQAGEGSRLQVELSGEAGGVWTLAREAAGWQLYAGAGTQPDCRLRMAQGLAWRLFTRALSAQEARSQVEIQGKMALGEQALRLVSIMA